MSTESTAVVETTQTAAPPPVATTAVVVETKAAPEKKSSALVEMPSDKFKERLEEERTKARSDALAAFYKQIGVADEKEAADLVSAAKKLADEKRTELERRDIKIKELEAFKTKAEKHADVIATYAKSELSALTDDQRSALAEVAGDDPGAQLKALSALKRTWQAATPTVTVGVAPGGVQPIAAAPLAPIAAPANTAVAATAPAAPAPGAPIDHLAVYDGLEKTNPFHAARYLTEHSTAITAAKRQRGDYNQNQR